MSGGWPEKASAIRITLLFAGRVGHGKRNALTANTL
jgi:hypothetical protein